MWLSRNLKTKLTLSLLIKKSTEVCDYKNNKTEKSLQNNDICAI